MLTWEFSLVSQNLIAKVEMDDEAQFEPKQEVHEKFIGYILGAVIIVKDQPFLRPKEDK